jgi:hypothetical protein
MVHGLSARSLLKVLMGLTTILMQPKLVYQQMPGLYFTLTSIPSLDNPPNSEMKFCENMKLKC